MSEQTNDRRKIIAKLAELVSELRVGVLSVLGEDGVHHSCPMMTVETTFDGDLWFFTGPQWPLENLIQEGKEVVLIYACPKSHRYVSISGRAAVVQDQKKIETLWDDSLAKWVVPGQEIPEGETGPPPNVSLLRIDAVRAEYWDARSGQFSKMFDSMKSLMTGGERRGTDHADIAWSVSR